MTMGISICTLASRAVLFLAFAAAAFGQCTFTVNPSGRAYSDSLGYLDTSHDPLVIQATASAQTCARTADSSDGLFRPVITGSQRLCHECDGCDYRCEWLFRTIVVTEERCHGRTTATEKRWRREKETGKNL
jgi:hypothetical protein